MTNHIFYTRKGRLHDPWCKYPPRSSMLALCGHLCYMASKVGVLIGLWTHINWSQTSHFLGDKCNNFFHYLNKNTRSPGFGIMRGGAIGIARNESQNVKKDMTPKHDEPKQQMRGTRQHPSYSNHMYINQVDQVVLITTFQHSYTKLVATYWNVTNYRRQRRQKIIIYKSA